MEIDVSIHFKHKSGYRKFEVITLSEDEIIDVAIENLKNFYEDGAVQDAKVWGCEAILP